MKNKKFREMLNAPEAIIAPGVYDAMGARIVESLGFSACYMTGNGAVASHLGLPDIGLAGMDEMTRVVRNITSRIDIPLISDADNCYGELNSTWRAVRMFEAAGASAIHIEDQISPKRCGAMKGVRLHSEEEAVEKIKIALKARTDPDFVIIARTDARRVFGLDAAIQRARAFAEAGADVVFVEQLESLEEIRKIVDAVSIAPVMYDILEEKKELAYTVDEVINQGAKIVIFALSGILFAAQNLKHLYSEIRDTGTTKHLFEKLMPLHDYEELLGLGEENAIRNKL